MVVQFTGGEGSQGLTVQAVRRGGTGFDDVAFVQFQFYFTGNRFLSFVNECIESFSQRSEPLTVVNQISVFQSNLSFVVSGFFVQTDGFQNFVCMAISIMPQFVLGKTAGWEQVLL